MTHILPFADRCYTASVAATTLLLLSSVTVAADPAKEAAAVELHAGMAANASAIEQVHMHLHHVINCLVGPKGSGFDASQANPCQALGDGAIPDAVDAAAKSKLATALAKAQAGLKSDDLAVARRSAAEAQSALK